MLKVKKVSHTLARICVQHFFHFQLTASDQHLTKAFGVCYLSLIQATITRKM